MKINPTAKGQLVNKKELSEIFGISERTLTDWQKEESFPIENDAVRGASNAYDTAKVLRFLLDRQQKKFDEGQSSLARAKTEEAEAGAALKRLTYNEKLGELINKAEAVEFLKKWSGKANQEYRDGIDQLIEDIEEQLDIEVPGEIPDKHVTDICKRVGGYALELAGGGDGSSGRLEST